MEPKQAELELSFIKKVMEDSRRVTIDNGMGFIIWGILGLGGIVLTYVNYFLHLGISSLYIWLGIFGIGLLHLFYTLNRENKNEKVKTFAGTMLGSVWAGCLITSAFMMTIPLFVTDFPGRVTLSSIIFVIGIGYFISSYILSNKWIKYNSYVWWAIGFLNLLLVFPHSQMLFLGILLLFFQIIPGYMLYGKWKKELSNTSIE